MVDIGSEISGAPAKIGSMVKPLSVSSITSRERALAYVKSLDDDLLNTGYQSKNFLRAWLSQESSKPYFLIFAKTGFGRVLLPLELQANGIATYCGGTHANGNFPVGKRKDIEALQDVTKAELVNCLQRLADPPDALFLERQYSQYGGITNPFVFGTSAQSPNVALSLSLEGGFTKVLELHHGKRKRKRQRNHMRKLEAMGNVEIIQHVPCDEVQNVLGAFFEMKAKRFKEQGICDVFSEPGVRDMFAQLFMESCALEKPSHVLKAIKLDEKLISVIGCTIDHERLTVEFGTFDNEYAAGGPGDLLFYHAIENACDSGLKIFDFGIGDEFYKRSWCEIETWHRDTLLGVNARGRLKSAFKSIRGTMVRRLKSNKVLWANAKLVRKQFGWLNRC